VAGWIAGYDGAESRICRAAARLEHLAYLSNLSTRIR
jgi:hypothetical protein